MRLVIRSDNIGAFVDITGKRMNSLTVIKRLGTASNGGAIWLCKCDCGRTTEIRSWSILSEHTKSCGHCPVNQYVTQGDVTIGKTASGKEFSFDTVDLPLVKSHTWHMDFRNCVVTLVKKKSLRLHTLIMGYTGNLQIDHINNDPSDNRKKNLRIVTPQQNNFNMPIRSNNTSGFKGVCFSKKAKKYLASIS